MDMVGHPAPRKDTDAELLTVSADDFCIAIAIFGIVEDRRSAYTALSNVMCGAGDDDSGIAGHVVES